MFVTVGKTVRAHLEQNGAKYFFMLLCWVVGVTAGTLFAGSLPVEKAEELAASMDNFCRQMSQGQVSGGMVFRTSAVQYGRMVLVLMLSSLSLWLVPLIFIQLGAKGFSGGFALCFLGRLYGWRGFLLAAVSVIPQLLLGMPAILLLSALCLTRSLSKYQVARHTGSERKSRGNRFTYYLVFILLILLLSAGVEALVVPVFSSLICGYLTP